LPFVWIGIAVLFTFNYSLFVAIRLLKAPFPNALVDSWKHWSGDNENVIEQRNKDLMLVFAVVIPVLVMTFFGWLWLIVTLSLYVLTIVGAFLYALPKKDVGKRENNEK